MVSFLGVLWVFFCLAFIIAFGLGMGLKAVEWLFS